jgi:hypothetical protein
MNILSFYLSATKTNRLKAVEIQETWLIICKAFIIMMMIELWVVSGSVLQYGYGMLIMKCVKKMRYLSL